MLFNNRKGMIARFALFLTLLGGIFGVSSVQAINTAESSFNASGLVAQESDNLSHVQVETALLVKDVNPGAASSGSFDYDFEYMNGMLYLSAGDETFGGELWKSDGTSDGTVLVKDINAGSFSSSLRHLTNVVGMLYFSAYDGIHGHELWKSDGTAEGTALVKDIRPGTNQNTNSSSPNFLTNVSGVLYFAAYDSANGMELWKSDGTAEGTVVVRDINPGSNNSNPENLINVNGTLFFTADDGTHRTELWKSDGTAEGTVLVKDIFPGIVGSYPYHFTDVNGTLYFVAAGDLNGYDDYELWKSDGTSAGTTLVKDIWPGVYPSYPDEFENVNGILYFEASDGVHGNELWKTNGTSAGTVMVKDIWPGERGWGSDITHVGTTVYFGAQDGLDYSLWKSDGTSAGTVKVAGPGPSDITSANGIVYYSASDGIHGYELWKSDGTASGTELVRDINPTGDSWPDLFFDANGTLYFRANDGVHGTELWKIGWGDPPPPTSTPSITPSPIFTLTPSATPGPITISGTTGVEGVTLSYFDGADKTVISDSNGDYVISIVANSWSGTVRPFKPGYRFWPTTRSYSNITGSVSNSDYTAERLFTISGNAGAAGAILSYTDGTAKSVTADSNGIYSIQVPENWTGMVAPYKSHYRFTPANRTFSNVRADQPNQDFMAQRVVFISGSTGISGVTLSYTDGIPKTVTSGSGGNYWIEVRENWSGTIIPSKTGFIFTPSSRAYSDMVDDRLSENYTWSPIVTNVNDSGAGSLRQAISNAISGTTIYFDPSLAGQTITLASQLDINKNLSIDGSGLTPRVTISGNQAVRIFSIGFSDAVALKSLILKDGMMSGTTYTTFGGAIYTNNYTVLTMTDVALIGNRAYQAGAIYVSPYANVTILDSELTSNSSDSIGGAIYTQSIGNLTVKNSLLQNNRATGAGGALYLAAAGTRLLENNTFSGNSAGSAGAIMIAQTSNSNVTIRGNLFKENSSTSSVGGGGALRINISSIPAILKVENNTFYANQAANIGGAVWSEGISNFNNNTFSNNQANKTGGTGGGSLYLSSGFGTYLYNNILANNTGGGECSSSGSNYVEGQNNLVEDGLGLCSTLAGTIIADPLLGSLSSNGGSTQTMALLPGSAAIDGGDNAFCTSTDQRGVTRPQGSACDIGAFEYVAPPATPTPTPTNTPTFTPTYTATSTFTPTATPSYSYNPLYLSLTGNQTIGGVSSADEDILRFDGSTWSLFFDGSDVGVASLDLFAFSIVDADTILMSFNNAITLGGLAVAPQDVVQFDATLLGSATTGIFSMYLDGSDVGLDVAAEKIDSVSLLTDGRVLISTTGNPSIAGLTGLADEDILAFTPVTLGDSTTGTWALYFDGSDVGLSTTSNEDIDALDVTSNGNIYLSTLGDFAVTGISGFDEDVFVCVPTSLGNLTACNYAPALYFDGSTWGLTANDVDAFNFLSLGPVSTSTPTIIPSNTSTNTPTRTPSPTPTRTPTIFITYTPSPIFTTTSTPTRTNTPTKTSTPTLTPTLPRGVFDVRILSHEPSPSNIGEAVTFTVSVTDFGGGPARSVTVNIVSDEGSTSCTTSETSSTCSSQLTFNNPSGHLIMASVDGDSAQVDHYVNPPSTNTPTHTPTTTATLIPTITSTPGASDVIFKDSFESGNLSAWSSSTTDLSDLSVSPAAALVDNQGMQAVIDDAVSIYVNDDTPNAEPRYRARFYFDPNSITMASGDAHFIFKGFAGIATDVLQVEFRNSSGAYQIRAKLLNDSSAFVNTNWFTISDGLHFIELDWRAATAAGANNGGLTLWIDGTQQADLASVDNDTWRIDRARLGALSGMDAGTSGTYYFDAFVSRRQSYIGP